MVNLVLMLITTGRCRPTCRGKAEAVTLPRHCAAVGDERGTAWRAPLPSSGEPVLCETRMEGSGLVRKVIPLGGSGSPQLSSDFLTLRGAVSHCLGLDNSSGEGGVLIFKDSLGIFLRRALSEVWRKAFAKERQKSE